MNSAKVIKLPSHSVQILLNAENERGMGVPAFGDGEETLMVTLVYCFPFSSFCVHCLLFSFYFSQQLLELRR